jgi:hypothetical protein
MRRRRWLIATESDGSESVQPVPWDAVVTRIEDIPRNIAVNWDAPESRLLVAIASACLARMGERAEIEARARRASLDERGLD